LETAPEASIYVGLKRGVNRNAFEQALKQKKLSECFHQLKSENGKVMFLPSGRVHGIGAGNVILEIQQNSDTTYRVYDWDRVGDDGQPRDLHVEQSLQSIRFDDTEPFWTQPHGERILSTSHFSVQRIQMFQGEDRELCPDGSSFVYVFISQGEFRTGETLWRSGHAVFITANHEPLSLEAVSEYAEFITVTW
jgi:mannose-6-phosphate isomerase